MDSVKIEVLARIGVETYELGSVEVTDRGNQAREFAEALRRIADEVETAS